jgi:hypothetical protein
VLPKKQVREVREDVIDSADDLAVGRLVDDPDT